MNEATFVHPLAVCESEEIGAGTRIWPFAHVMKGARVGKDCNVGEGVFVESGAQVGDRVTLKNGVLVWKGVEIADDVFVGPGVIFTNDRRPRSPRMPEAAHRYRDDSWCEPTRVARGASIGAGAVVVAGCTIGAYAMVGAGALVTKGVPAHALVLGQPAHVVGYVCACGDRLDAAYRCGGCGAVHERAGDEIRRTVVQADRP